ncbi:RICIN domain-containing protein [Catellatospora methionotrophica]|uniref:RICIN domain-containing protein n=1 Tax=Catellatospora methionotrophica TaxID=121620 RepID=UPI00340BF278
MFRRLLAAALSVLTLTALGGVVGAAPAAAALPPGGQWSPYYRIVAQHSGKCLDVAWRGTHDGADVIQANCNYDLATNANQLWRVYYPGHIGGFAYYVAKHSGKCLDVAWGSFDNGADILQSLCGGAGAGGNQRWQRVDAGGVWFALRAEHSYKCMEVAWASTAHTANVVQNACYAVAHQRWRLELA